MHVQTEISECLLRPWRTEDKPSLILHANNRNVWRNLADMFPHPYTEADADHWLSIASAPGPSIHLAIDLQGQAVGGIGVIAAIRTTFLHRQYRNDPEPILLVSASSTAIRGSIPLIVWKMIAPCSVTARNRGMRRGRVAAGALV